MAGRPCPGFRGLRALSESLGEASVGLSLDTEIRCRPDSGATGICLGGRQGIGMLSSEALSFSCPEWWESGLPASLRGEHRKQDSL